MATLTPTTELDAVNTMLSTIGEAPVNTLDMSGNADVASALNTLSEISRDVQMPGWHFNFEHEFPLSPNNVKHLLVPMNTLRADASASNKQYDVVLRGNKLYDRKNHSYVFDKIVKMDIVLFLPFTELPEAARRYITIRASRTFANRTIGDEASHYFTKQDEVDALAVLKQAEAEDGDYNIFNNWDVVQPLLR